MTCKSLFSLKLDFTFFGTIIKVWRLFPSDEIEHNGFQNIREESKICGNLFV